LSAIILSDQCKSLPFFSLVCSSLPTLYCRPRSDVQAVICPSTMSLPSVVQKMSKLEKSKGLKRLFSSSRRFSTKLFPLSPSLPISIRPPLPRKRSVPLLKPRTLSPPTYLSYLSFVFLSLCVGSDLLLPFSVAGGDLDQFSFFYFSSFFFPFTTAFSQNRAFRFFEFFGPFFVRFGKSSKFMWVF